MEISNDNMFYTGYGFFIGKNPYLLRDKLSIKAKIRDRFHLVQEGDNLRILSYAYYKDIVQNAQNWWWALADVNNLEKNDLSSLVGTNIFIPDFFVLQRELSNTRSFLETMPILGEPVFYKDLDSPNVLYSESQELENPFDLSLNIDSEQLYIDLDKLEL